MEQLLLKKKFVWMTLYWGCQNGNNSQVEKLINGKSSETNELKKVLSIIENVLQCVSLKYTRIYRFVSFRTCYLPRSYYDVENLKGTIRALNQLLVLVERVIHNLRQQWVRTKETITRFSYQKENKFNTISFSTWVTKFDICMIYSTSSSGWVLVSFTHFFPS
ncbi:hypothetical protein BDA99DRAFT_575676 [Phascolomyces articulosus]|uniref:Uncharacterized protein n=1 Tax=Phascolomyces articulosus TaxID=60185 RepID=A0AAD5P979_9FUNG|nr:hypothetical protein BDA99DRAFT_575676 [Phascolomyces articulosus]